MYGTIGLGSRQRWALHPHPVPSLAVGLGAGRAQVGVDHGALLRFTAGWFLRTQLDDEATGGQRRHVDLLHATLRIEQQKLEYRDGTLEVGPPKTASGRRLLHLPGFLVPELDTHLRAFVGPGADAWVFAGTDGGLLRERSFNRAWYAARAASSLPSGFRFHDLRHTATTLTAATGASTRELMARMGHASARAAIRYQHATADRDRVIADLLDGLVTGRERQAAPKRNPDVA